MLGAAFRFFGVRRLGSRIVMRKGDVGLRDAEEGAELLPSFATHQVHNEELTRFLAGEVLDHVPHVGLVHPRETIGLKPHGPIEKNAIELAGATGFRNLVRPIEGRVPTGFEPAVGIPHREHEFRSRPGCIELSENRGDRNVAQCVVAVKDAQVVAAGFQFRDCIRIARKVAGAIPQDPQRSIEAAGSCFGQSDAEDLAFVTRGS